MPFIIIGDVSVDSDLVCGLRTEYGIFNKKFQVAIVLKNECIIYTGIMNNKNEAQNIIEKATNDLNNLKKKDEEKSTK